MGIESNETHLKSHGSFQVSFQILFPIETLFSILKSCFEYFHCNEG